MRILIYSPSNAIGGAELSLLSIVKELKSRNYEIFFALPKGKDTSYENMILPFVNEIFYFNAMPWIYYGKPSISSRIFNFFYNSYKTKGSYFTPIYKFYKIIKKRKIDITLTNTIQTFDLGLASFFAGKKHFQYVREPIISETEGLVNLKLPNIRIVKQFYGLIHHKIICNSIFTMKSCSNFFPLTKLNVIYNIIEEPKTSLKKTISSEINIITVANLTANWKNHVFVIKLAHYLKTNCPLRKFKFHFFGSLPNGENLYFSNLKKLVFDLELNDIVVFEGSVSQSKIYEMADIMVHPSGIETFGRIYVEAMANCVPVISVSGGAANELITNWKNGILVSKDSIQNCAKEIIKLVDTEMLREDIINAGLIFSKKFRPTEIGNQLEEVFQS